MPEKSKAAGSKKKTMGKQAVTKLVMTNFHARAPEGLKKGRCDCFGGGGCQCPGGKLGPIDLVGVGYAGGYAGDFVG
jgi:hypothetical protein